MNISQIVERRNIKEIVHFTSSHGCLGVVYTGRLQSRICLENDYMVKYLFEPNSVLRKDIDYIDFVNLSISHINANFFSVCSRSWHQEKKIFWCILSFSPRILCHAGVQFATTNNIYTGVRRAPGSEGLEALFADRVVQWGRHVALRTIDLPMCYPTCSQAEVLYPSYVSIEYLQCIYVKNLQDQSEVMGYLRAVYREDIKVVVFPKKFESRPHAS